MEVLNGVNNNSILTKFNATHVKKSYVFNEFNPKIQSLCKNGRKFGENLGKLGLKVENLGYENKGHLEYYGEKINCNINNNKGKNGWSKISTKKKMKLLKGLSKDLSTFSGFGFVLSSDGCDGGEDKSMIVSKAAEVLLAQLKQLKLEEEKQKKKEKEEKKCKNEVDSSSSSSSESSESSDSECDEVVDLKRMRTASVVAPIETNKTQLIDVVPLPITSSISPSKGLMNDQMSLTTDQSCCNMILETTLDKDPIIDVLSPNTVSLNVPNVGKKIEVCMGGKCKKSGAPTLIEAFQNVVGDEGVVVGCKCMGKCKSAPNVKLSNGVGESFGDDSLRSPSNPLYIGVGLEDVELIVSSYFGSSLSTAVVAT